jgi:hypothetical protein
LGFGTPDKEIFMATLILTVVGAAIGGPVGGAIGAALGQQVDSRLFAPKARQGPRLGELAFQSSTYGAPIPKVFGRMRIGGSVIWATDIKEDRRKVSTGKGRPKQTVYSYSASFAVALSGRAILRVGRIWADGKLLRGDGGDFKTQTGFRLHLGGADQSVDPLIATVEGSAGTPAYRGLAYAMFEDFQLADFGNRIPSLSFEVIADEAPVSIGSVLDQLAGRPVASLCPTLIDGIAVTGDSVRGVAEAFGSVIPLFAWDMGTALRISEAGRAGPTLAADQLGAGIGERPKVALERHRGVPSQAGGRRTLAYYDVDRDYLQGAQSAIRPDLGNRERRIDLASSLSAARAKQLVSRSLAEDTKARDQIHLALGPRYLDLAPGMIVSIPAISGATVSGQWMVHDVSLEAMIVKVVLQKSADAAVAARGADPGRGVFEADQPIGPTRLHLMDLPWLGDGLASAPSVAVAAAGPSLGWRRAALLQSRDGGLSFEEIGSTAPSAVIGTASTVLAASSTAGFDTENVVDVTLINGAMDLSDTTNDGLVAGQNLALLGDELIQFGRAMPLGSRQFRLSNLLRGRRGSEAAMVSHVVGDRFILLQSESILPLAVPAGTQAVTLSASGLGDLTPVTAVVANIGRALLPLSPVHIVALRLTNGDTRINWMRRSRDGWHWIDGVDAPLGEESELYSVTVGNGASAPRSITVAVPEWTYSAVERAVDAAAGAAQVGIEIRQLGTYGQSRPAQIFQSTL